MLRDKERSLSERLSEVGSEGAEKSGLSWVAWIKPIRIQLTPDELSMKDELVSLIYGKRYLQQYCSHLRSYGISHLHETYYRIPSTEIENKGT